jgi:Fe-S-cluster containining protein
VSRIFSPVPFERFDAFHRAFNGEGRGIWTICAQCGGRCEQHKIGTLMPGEKEYIAARLGWPVEKLEAKYLDRLVTPRGTVDVLKLKPGCNFLDACFHCTLADHKLKPILCEVYPVVFEVDQTGGSEDDPRLEVRFLVDELDCPLMHASYEWAGRRVTNPDWQAHRDYFSSVGISLLRAVDAPPEWYRAVAQYDAENFDYGALEKVRHVAADAYDTFTLDELMSGVIGHAL